MNIIIDSAQAALGLTSAEAEAAYAEWGPNTVPPPRPPSPWRRVVVQLRDPLILVLIVAAVLTMITGDYKDTIVILFVVVANTAVGVLQEIRAERAIAALTEMAAPAARVVRDGVSRSLPASELVPGDLVELDAGDVVPADLRLLEAPAFQVDESALTGESVPVDKSPNDPAYAGTVVTHGRAKAVVTATGPGSALGRIAALLTGHAGLTPLQRRLAALGRLLAATAVVLCTVVLVIGLLRGQPFELMLVTAISLVVAAVPESLPAVVTLALAVGARRMAARHAIVRHLPAVETLGSVTVLATDKTGTLTEGRMVAEMLWTPYGETLLPPGDGAVVMDSDAPGDATRRLVEAAALCNDAEIRRTANGSPALGDPTEVALLVAADRLGVDRDTLRATNPRLGEVPFDSLRKRMTTVHRAPDGSRRVACKGAPDVLLTGALLTDAGPVRDTALQRAHELAEGGYRVMAVAERTDHVGNAEPGDPDPERCLHLLGLVAIADPPRPAAREAIAALRGAGVLPVLITGDHPATAGAIARRLGIVSGPEDLIVTGDAPVPDIERVRVYARTSPESKVRIVDEWRAAGHVVAMTGDGVNDGPALKRADIGVAMGQRGTEVARQAADLVLADDNLHTVVAAVEEGRRVHANVRRFLLYGLSGGVAEILVMLIGPFVGMTLPLLPAQILFINLLTHGLPGVAMGAEPAEKGLLSRPPRPPEESILGDGLAQGILRVAIVITAATLGLGIWAHETGRPWQTVVFLALGAAQLGAAVASRARGRIRDSRFLLVAVAAAFALQIAAVYAGFFQEILGTESLTLLELGVTMSAGIAGYVAVHVNVRRARRRPGRATDVPA